MSDKFNLKLIKKRAELAKSLSPNSIGERFPNTYDWGESLLEVILSMEARIRELEAIIESADLTMNRYLRSDAIIFITSSQTIDSSAEVV